MLRTLQLLGSEISPYNHSLRPHALSLLISSSRSAITVSHPRLKSVGGRSKALRMSSCRAESNPDVAAAPSASVASSAAATAHKPNVSFCQSCGGPTKLAVPEGEEKMRAVCTLCGRIFYENPKMVVGCLVEHDAKVLLCKRNIQPSYGLWTLPAGFLEMGESAAEGAMRETLEEACAEVEVLSPFAQLDIPRIGQFLYFTCSTELHNVSSKAENTPLSPGPESLECALFSLDDIPFDSLAFSSIYVTLKMYSEDIKLGRLNFHYATINKRQGASPSDPGGFLWKATIKLKT